MPKKVTLVLMPDLMAGKLPACHECLYFLQLKGGNTTRLLMEANTVRFLSIYASYKRVPCQLPYHTQQLWLFAMHLWTKTLSLVHANLVAMHKAAS